MRSPVSSGRTGIKSPKSKLRAVFPSLDVTGEHGFMFRRVVLESPLAGFGTPFAGQLQTNILYARACVRDSLSRGEAPIASHLLYAQPGILNEKVEAEREFGIAAGHAWIAMAFALVVYKDRGISNGMKRAVNIAEAMDKPIEYRELGEQWDK